MIAGVVPAMGIAATEEVLLSWLETARPGEHLVYHLGHLGLDRYPGESPLPAPLREELVRLADRALALAESGRVLLAQKRLDGRHTAYLAIKATAPTHGKEERP